ncbi:hypothetical protein PSHT_07301 [Puccinia striiformis]|uniref:Uncharacterized protein n=2 Tax=Puccinia striiformis TaxID=27350 RepID=A0A2S4VZS1_9BASI|nr:hypothetical protein PSHT_07301 [Puccinia striiformis]POW15001.1 hypothetical protein PSTT_02482 [Puccinia striiformis]
MKKIACAACTSAGLNHSCTLDMDLRACTRCVQTQDHCSFLRNPDSLTRAAVQWFSEKHTSLRHDIDLLAAQSADMNLETDRLEWYTRFLAAQLAQGNGYSLTPLITTNGRPGRRNKFVVYIL